MAMPPPRGAPAQQRSPAFAGDQPIVFEGFTTLNTDASRPGIENDQMFICDGFMPLGKNNLRTLYGVGASIFNSGEAIPGPGPGPAPPTLPEINPLSPYATDLLFFFIVNGAEYLDLVKGDTMSLNGTYSSVSTPFGAAWLLGDPNDGSKNGWATTAGGNSYYQPASVPAISMAVGIYNTTNVNTPEGTGVLAQWTAPANITGSLIISLFNLLNVDFGRNDAVGGGGSQTSNNYIIDTINAGPAGHSLGLTYDGAHYATYLDGSSEATFPATEVPSGMDRVELSATGGNPAQRALIWCGGWASTLSTMAGATSANGGYPPGLVITP